MPLAVQLNNPSAVTGKKLTIIKGLKTILKQPADRLWIKASAPYRLPIAGDEHVIHNHISALNSIFTDHLGADRVLWGSDWPFTQFEQSTTYEDMIKIGALGGCLI